MIERVRLQVQVSKMRFLQKIKGITSLTRCISLKNQKSLEPLLLQIKRYQLRWFGQVSKMHQEKPKQALLAKVNRKKKQLNNPELL